MFPTRIVIAVSMKLPESASNFLFAGFRIIGINTRRTSDAPNCRSCAVKVLY
jgi:hypothetical protein